MKRVRAVFMLRLFFLVFTCGVLALSLPARQTSKKGPSTAGGKIDLNTASEKDLETLPGVGPATAKKIIAGRPYASVDELSKAGVSSKVISQISPLVTASGGTETPASKAAEPAGAPSAPTPPAKTSASASSGASQATPGAGMVWVNLDSGVYHYPSSRYYGKTKNGRYMSETDAMSAGYHAAKNEKKPTQ